MDKVIAYVRGLKGPRFPNLELLDNDGVTLDGVRVLGSTLWSDVPPSATQASPPFAHSSELELR